MYMNIPELYSYIYIHVGI